jgi:hypothetical protein|tara:strand:+ start:128 stop:1273 length:1146 start_codon:yes stop_codon:yes gene_type:complete
MSEDTASPEGTVTSVDIPAKSLDGSDAAALDLIESRLSPFHGGPERTDEDPDEITPVEESQAEDATEEVPAETEAEEAPETEETEVEEPTEEPEWVLPEEWTVDEMAEAIGVEPDALKKSLRHGDQSLDDALKGTLREADYTQKTQALSADRKAFEAEREETTQQWQQRFQQIDNIGALLAQQLDTGPTEEDLLRLLDPNMAEYDPDSYHRLKAERDLKMSGMQEFAAQRQQLMQQAADEQQQKIQAYRTEQQEIARTKLPELATQEGTAKFQARLEDQLPQHFGFSVEEVGQWMNGAWDVRQLQLIDAALKYMALETKKPELAKKLKPLPKVQKPGVQQGKADTTAKDQAALRKRLKTGTRQQRDEAALGMMDRMSLFKE